MRSAIPRFSRFSSLLRNNRFLLPLGIIATVIAIAYCIWIHQPKEIIFKDFPTDIAKKIDFNTTSESFNRLSDREKKDQYLDWLVFAIASDRDFTADRINETLFDLPTMRHDYMKPVADFEYGETRHINLDKKVVGLVPKADTKENRNEHIGYIADSYRKTTGEKPETVQIFEYEFQPYLKSATLTHTADIKKEDIYSDKYGYYEEQIDNLADLKKFTAEVNDITHSRLQDTKLVVGGRKISNRPQTMTVEDIAALWQSEKAIAKDSKYKDIHGSGFSLDSDYDYEGLAKDLKKAEPFLKLLKLKGKAIIADKDIKNAKLSLTKAESIVQSLKLDSKAAGTDKDIEKGKLTAKAKQEAWPYFELIANLKKNQDRFLKESESALTLKNKELEIRKQKLKEKSIVLRKKRGNYDAELAANQKENIQPSYDSNKFEGEENILKQKNQEIGNLELQLSKEGNTLSSIKDQLSKLGTSRVVRGLQFARYDGTLKGTKVGMTLFYTDLLAKLWEGNYDPKSTPTSVQGFTTYSQIASKISSIYKDEVVNSSSTRIWFDPQIKGYQKTKESNNKSGLLFTHNATKINAKSSTLQDLRHETIAEPIEQKFIDWWDRHYDELARYEPQYQKLNQIMKWSILIGWFNSENQKNISPALDILDSRSVTVKHDYWFPDWVQANKQQLKFQFWDNQSHCKNFNVNNNKLQAVCFYDRNHRGHQTETLPSLSSEEFIRFGDPDWHFYGGVSLANKSSIGSRDPLTNNPKISKLSKSSLRSDIDYKSVKPGEKSFSFTKNELVKDAKGQVIENKTIKYSFTKSDPSKKISATNITKAGKDIKLRSQATEVNNLDFTNSISRVDNGIQIKTIAKGIPVEDLSTKKTPNGFQIGFNSRDMDAGQSLAFDLSGSKKPLVEALKTHPNVRSAYTDGSVFYIETNNSTQLLELTLEVGGGGKGGGIGGGSGNGGGKPPWDSRVGFPGDPKESNGNYRLVWKDKKKNNGYKNGKLRIVDKQEEIIPQIISKKSRFQISKIDEALKNNDPNLALQMIHYEMEATGRTPTLLVRKAVAEIQKGKLEIRSLVFEQSVDNSTELSWAIAGEYGKRNIGEGSFLDEVNRITNGKNKFRVKKKGDAVFYIQDSPGLNNIDWNQPIESIFSGSSSSKKRLYQTAGSGGGGGNGDKLGGLGYEPESPKSGAPANEYQKVQGSFNPIIPPGISDEKCEDNQKQKVEDSSNQIILPGRLDEKCKDGKWIKVYIVTEVADSKQPIESSNPQ
jgi:hypothetical protein